MGAGSSLSAPFPGALRCVFLSLLEIGAVVFRDAASIIHLFGKSEV